MFFKEICSPESFGRLGKMGQRPRIVQKVLIIWSGSQILKIQPYYEQENIVK